MADQIVGRVFVKVTPDTSKFREEARVALEREEKRLPKLEVDLTVDLAEGTTQKVAAQARAASAAAQAALEDLTLRVNLDDTGSIQQAIAQINRELVDLNKIEIPVGLDEDDLRGMRSLLEERLREIGVTIKVDLDDDGDIERAIRQIDSELTALRRIDLQVGLDRDSLESARALLVERLEANAKARVEPELDNKSTALTEGALRLLTRARDVVIRPVADRSAMAALSAVSVLSGWRALTQTVDQARSVFTRLFSEMPQVMTMTTQVLALSGAFASASANVVGLLGSVAQLVPLLLTLPGIAIGIGTMAAALQDFGDVLPGIAARFAGLQQAISDGFWAIARGPIANLLDAVLPVLSAGLSDTAQQIGAFFASLAGQLGAAGGFLSALPGMFAHLSESIAIFTGHTPALAQILTIFGQLGSGMLPPLAELVGQIADEFARWLTEATADGGMESIISSAIASLSGLFEVVKGAAQIFAGFWSAASAAGAATLTSLGQGLQAFADRLSDPAIQTMLSGLFDAAFTGMDKFLALAGPAFEKVITALAGVLTTVLPQVGQVLGGIAEALGQAFANPALTSGFTSFIQGVLTGISALTPLLAPLGDLIGALGPTLGTLAATIGQVIGSLAPSFNSVLLALQPLITLLGGALSQVLTSVSPLITALGETLGQVFTGLAPALQPVLDALTQLLSDLVPQLTPIIQQVAPLLMQIVNIVMPVLANLLQAIAPMLGSIVQAFAPILGLISELLGLLTPILIPVLTILGEVLATSVQWVIEGVIKAMRGLLNVLLGVIDFVVGVFTGDWSKAWDGIKQIFQGIWDIIVGVVQAVLGATDAKAILGILKKGIGAIRTFWDDAWGAVKSFFTRNWDEIVNFLRGALDNIVNFFKGLWGRISGFVTGMFDSLFSFYRSGMSRAAGAISDGIATAVKYFKDFPGRILSALGNLANTLIGPGKNLIKGLLNGIKSMAGEIISTIKSYVLDKIPDQIKKFFGIHSPSRMFFDFGVFLMEGLALGIEDESDRVLKALDSVMSDVEAYEFKPPQPPSLGVNGSLYNGAAPPAGGQTIIYNAAPGNSLSAEEDLFAALGRARAGW